MPRLKATSINNDFQSLDNEIVQVNELQSVNDDLPIQNKRKRNNKEKENNQQELSHTLNESNQINNCDNNQILEHGQDNQQNNQQDNQQSRTNQEYRPHRKEDLERGESTQPMDAMPSIPSNNVYKDDENNLYVEQELLYEEQSAKHSFFLSSLSIDETRLSVLILCLLSCMIFGGVNYILVGDITANLTNIILTLIYAIAGVNITNAVVNTFGNNNNNNCSRSNEMIVNARDANNNPKRKKFSLKKMFSL